MTDPGNDQLIGERFEVRGLLGVGAQGRTYKARDLDSGDLVALKRLTMADAADWKAVELFEREAAVLRDLNHARIPSYIDAFSVEDGDAVAFYLAQGFVDGENLQDILDADGKWSEEEVVDFLDQMLSILSYLESRRPPVVHRDIKPSNVIRDPEGQYHLVDFGAVQNKLASAGGNSTVIGTGGFVPVEQLMGRATPRSDLYALGATAVYLVSGEHPAEMAVRGLRLRFRDRIGAHIDPRLGSLLEDCLAPNPSERPGSAAEALERLRSLADNSPVASPFPQKLEPDGLIHVNKTDTKLIIDVLDRASTRTAAHASAVVAFIALIASAGGLIELVYALIGGPFLFISSALAIALTLGFRGRRVEIDAGQIRVRRRPAWLGPERRIDIDELIGVVAYEGGVFLVDGVQSIELPKLGSSAAEVRDLICEYTGTRGDIS